MPIEPIDLTALVGTILGISIVLVPVIGITARFALTPLVEALGRTFESRSTNETLEILQQRLELQDQQIDSLQRKVQSLSDASSFDRQLGAGETSTDAG